MYKPGLPDPVHDVPVGAAQTDRPPILTLDGRPYVREPDEPDAELALWTPDPPRDGEAVYCGGVRVGTFHGNASRAGGWYVQMVPTRDMPAKLAARVRQRASGPLPAATQS